MDSPGSRSTNAAGAFPGRAAGGATMNGTAYGGYPAGRPLETAAARHEERRLRRQRELVQAAFPVTVAQIADRDYLYECFQTLRRDNGPAPGIDGITYDDLSNEEAGDLVGKLAAAVLDGTYR